MGLERLRARPPLSSPSSGRQEGPSTELWVVERLDDGIAFLVLDSDDDEPVVCQVSVELLGEVEEGFVLEVPLGSVGEPRWDEAQVVGRL